MQNTNLHRQLASTPYFAPHKLSRTLDSLAHRKRTGDVAVMEADEYGFITQWSKKAEQVYGFEADDMLGKHISSLYAISELVQGAPAIELMHVETSGQHFAFGWQKRKGGQEFWTYSECQLLTDREGKITGYRKFVVESASTSQ